MNVFLVCSDFGVRSCIITPWNPTDPYSYNAADRVIFMPETFQMTETAWDGSFHTWEVQVVALSHIF